MNIGIGIVFAIMAVFALFIVYDDMKQKDAVMWQLLGLTTTAILGVIIVRLCQGTFSWQFLLAIPFYIIFEIINCLFNKSKFLGQADLDIFFGGVAIAIALCIYIYQNICPCIADGAFMVIGSVIIEFMFWLLVGMIIDFGIVFIKWLVLRIKGIKTGLWRARVPACLEFMPFLFAVVFEAIVYLP